MKIVGIEILNMEDGSLRAVEVAIKKGFFEVENCLEGKFGQRIEDLNNKSWSELLVERDIKTKNVILILPENAYKSKIKEFQALPKAKDLERLMDSGEIKWNILGNVGSTYYGLVTSIPGDLLQSIKRSFSRMNLKFIIPKITAYSLFKCSEAQGHTCLLSVQGDSFTFLVYDNGVLIWQYTGAGDICEGVEKAVNLARNKRIYPVEIIVVGDDEDVCTLPEELSEKLGLPCRPEVYSQDDEDLDSGYTVLLSAMRGLLRSG